MLLHDRAVARVKAKKLRERSEPDVSTDVVATGLLNDHEVMEAAVSVEEREDETLFTALSNEIGTRLTDLF